MRIVSVLTTAVLLASVSTAVLAEDWTADRLRGGVAILQRGQWQPLGRGDVVPDKGKVRTDVGGRVELIRGKERISLAENTQIELRDGGETLMTSVVQSSGSVTVDAERRNVQHFSVQTPVLAAVVKGTNFTVTYQNGLSTVALKRGEVQVQDSVHDVVADIIPGQLATVSKAEALEVTGPGSDRIVYLIDGQFVPAAARETVLEGGEVPAEQRLTIQRQSDGSVTLTQGAVQGQGASSAVSTGNGAASASVSVGAGPVGASTGVAVNSASSSNGGGSVSAGSSVNVGGASANAGVSVGGSSGGSAGVSVSAGGTSVSVGVGSNSGSSGSNSGSNSSGSSNGGSGSSGSSNSGSSNNGSGSNSGSGSNNSGSNSGSSGGSGFSVSVGGSSVSIGSSGVSVSLGGLLGN